MNDTDPRGPRAPDDVHRPAIRTPVHDALLHLLDILILAHGTQSEVLDVGALVAAHRIAETVVLDLQGGTSNPILGPTNPTMLNSIVTEIEVLGNVAKAVLDIINARGVLVPLLAGVAVVLMQSEPV